MRQNSDHNNSTNDDMPSRRLRHVAQFPTDHIEGPQIECSERVDLIES